MIAKNFKFINKLLVLTSVILLGYLIWDSFNPNEPEFMSNDTVNKHTGSKMTKQIKSDLKSAYYYSDIVKVRNIFLPYNVVLKTTVVEIKPPEKPKIPLSSLITNLKIVGYSLEKPKMVMIENNENSRTHFLKEGDIINTLSIKQINEDHVILTDGEEDVTFK